MDPQAYNTLILSDLHLGSHTSHAREATQLLKKTTFQRLILLGDIFADLTSGLRSPASDFGLLALGF